MPGSNPVGDAKSFKHLQKWRSRHVRLPLSPQGELAEEEKGLFAPPENVEGFRQLTHRICSGKLVRSLLG